MKNKHIIILSAALLTAAPTFSATPDDGATQTLMINQEKIDRTVSEICIDGNNAVLTFTDGTTMTADMRFVTLTMNYDEATGISLTPDPSPKGEGSVYDLQGRQIVNGKLSNGQLPKGVYIVNGKKVVIK